MDAAFAPLTPGLNRGLEEAWRGCHPERSEGEGSCIRNKKAI